MGLVLGRRMGGKGDRQYLAWARCLHFSSDLRAGRGIVILWHGLAACTSHRTFGREGGSSFCGMGSLLALLLLGPSGAMMMWAPRWDGEWAGLVGQGKGLNYGQGMRIVVGCTACQMLARFWLDDRVGLAGRCTPGEEGRGARQRTHGDGRCWQARSLLWPWHRGRRCQ
jgi:hypothetical protein